jgi:hypothetical protein
MITPVIIAGLVKKAFLDQKHTPECLTPTYQYGVPIGMIDIDPSDVMNEL